MDSYEVHRTLSHTHIYPFTHTVGVALHTHLFVIHIWVALSFANIASACSDRSSNSDKSKLAPAPQPKSKADPVAKSHTSSLDLLPLDERRRGTSCLGFRVLCFAVVSGQRILHFSLVTNLTNRDLLVTLSVVLAKHYLYHLVDSERYSQSFL